MVSLSLSGWIKAAPRGLENFHCVAVLFYCIGSGVCVFLTCILSVFAACLLLMFLFWLSAAPFCFFNLQQASVTVFVLDFCMCFWIVIFSEAAARFLSWKCFGPLYRVSLAGHRTQYCSKEDSSFCPLCFFTLNQRTWRVRQQRL